MTTNVIHLRSIAQPAPPVSVEKDILYGLMIVGVTLFLALGSIAALNAAVWFVQRILWL